jgi:hypothetical protein
LYRNRKSLNYSKDYSTLKIVLQNYTSQLILFKKILDTTRALLAAVFRPALAARRPPVAAPDKIAFQGSS